MGDEGLHRAIVSVGASAKAIEPEFHISSAAT